MILTVTLNPCVDKTYLVEDFAINKLNRPSQALTVAGGKGLNVARVYTRLGGQALATGLLGGHNGHIVQTALAGEGIAHDFVEISKATRLCIKVVDPLHKTETEINEVGSTVSEPEMVRFMEHFERLLASRPFTMVAFCGSLPPGIEVGWVKTILRRAQQAGAKTVLDSSGAALHEGVSAGPWLVKPNRVELEELWGHSISSVETARCAASALRKRYEVEVFLCTLGADGALWITEKEAYQVKAPPVNVMSAVASGDSFLAGLLLALEKGDSVENALRLAAGAGAANAEVLGAGFCDAATVQRHAQQAQVLRLA
ncbi:MAG TPA: 1-phosphofructokinase family hexose kinase [Chthonomonas sp.]|uniref:1-phosphofructokinase family hexose kinase n=1 Tax=Chthonomonas sp. TaxID=2282153 RepID=UPI002B4B31ED|nr:1-phosphofructokinase family hexose kinase [Chthonomonas sp.]HLH79321.1 1-phosphofructokinase family hexose kinase [Chthonomonas sp.]